MVIVRPITLRITSPMPMGLTPRLLSEGVNLLALYGSVSSVLSPSVANFLGILATVFEISTDFPRNVLKCVSMSSVHSHGCFLDILTVYLIKI